jgi:hypothetical protein
MYKAELMISLFVYVCLIQHTPMVSLNAVDLRLVTRTIIYCPSPSFYWWVQEYSIAGVHVRNRTFAEQPNMDFITFKVRLVM